MKPEEMPLPDVVAHFAALPDMRALYAFIDAIQPRWSAARKAGNKAADEAIYDAAKSARARRQSQKVTT